MIFLSIFVDFNTLNKRLQFLLAISSTCLVLLLGLSTVNKTIHDGLFHPNFVTENNTIQSGCSGNHEGECKGNESSNHSQDCDASCPVNIFANGVLALDYIPEIITKTPVKCEVVSEYLIAQFSEEEKKSHLVRGPPEEMQV